MPDAGASRSRSFWLGFRQGYVRGSLVLLPVALVAILVIELTR